MEQFQISAKNLGALAMPGFCPKCFWLEMHCDELPFQSFPGIFSSIDSYSKKITGKYYEKHKTAPAWFAGFGELGEPVKVPHYSKFSIIDADTNIRLTGVPDEIFKRPDGSYFIADYKTARYTANQDALMPIYEVQLNGYAYIAERVGFSPISGVGLVYYEPQTDVSGDNVDSHTREKGFAMHFNASLHPLLLRPEMVKPLMKRAREIYDFKKAPGGTRDCDDCRAMEELVRAWG